MMNKHGDFIWYELMTTDADAAQQFYGGLVGWTFSPSGQPGMDYRQFYADGQPVGGLMQLTKEMQDGGARPLWAGYVKADNLEQTIEAIDKAGGGKLMGPHKVPGVGRLAFMRDPQGALFYVMQTEPGDSSESFAAMAPRVGHCAWNELMTEDQAGAKKFYGEVFGWVQADSINMGPMGDYDMLKCGADREFMFGAVMKQPPGMPVSIWNYYFRTPDIDASADYIEKNGGAVMNGPQEIPGGEFVITGSDPQGGMFSVIGARK